LQLYYSIEYKQQDNMRKEMKDQKDIKKNINRMNKKMLNLMAMNK